ncbi:hypothetical protein DV452_001422 [Geotrichum candidum]|nr:hypothetical protein DV452_001422 [Geotrichum candidum]
MTLSLEQLPDPILANIAVHVILNSQKFLFPVFLSGPSYTAYGDWNPITNVKDILALSCVSRRFKAVVDPILYKNIGTNIDVLQFQKHYLLVDSKKFFRDTSAPCNSLINPPTRSEFYLDYSSLSVPKNVLRHVQHLFVSTYGLIKTSRSFFLPPAGVFDPVLLPNLKEITLDLLYYELFNSTSADRLRALIVDHPNKLRVHVIQCTHEKVSSLFPLIVKTNLVEYVTTAELKVVGEPFLHNRSFEQSVSKMVNVEKLMIQYISFSSGPASKQMLGLPTTTVPVAELSRSLRQLTKVKEFEFSIFDNYLADELLIPPNVEKLTMGTRMLYTLPKNSPMERFDKIKKLTLRVDIFSDKELEKMKLWVPFRFLETLVIYDFEEEGVFIVAAIMAASKATLVNFFVGGINMRIQRYILHMLGSIRRLEFLLYDFFDIDTRGADVDDYLLSVLSSAPDLETLYLPVYQHDTPLERLIRLIATRMDRNSLDNLQRIHLYTPFNSNLAKSPYAISVKDLFPDCDTVTKRGFVISDFILPVKTYDSDVQKREFCLKSVMIDVVELKQILQHNPDLLK